jgi:maltose O-acetyltransferase
MSPDKEKMLAGKLYKASDSQLDKETRHAKKLTRQYNATTEDDASLRQGILFDLFNKIGSPSYIEPPFRTDYGINTTIGKNFYANYDNIFIDVAPIKIGDNCMFGPLVSLYTAGHPIVSDIRNEQLEFGKPISIGNNVWIGGNAVVNPGVTIGNNTVIGSGSVVTKDIPDNVVAAGNPCRVIRKITEQDQQYWEQEKRSYYQN